MAEHAVTTHHGEMPVKDHIATYEGVMGLFKWGALHTAVLLVFLVLWFCTPAGFWPALIVAVILSAIGIFALRKAHAPLG